MKPVPVVFHEHVFGLKRGCLIAFKIMQRKISSKTFFGGYGWNCAKEVQILRIIDLMSDLASVLECRSWVSGVDCSFGLLKNCGS